MIVGVLAALGGEAAWAQRRAVTPRTSRVEPPKPAAPARGAPRRVIRLKGDVIEGRVQKPEAFYVLQRTSLTVEGLKLKTKLVPKILEAVRKPPF
jgi:hypothetical protein